MNSNEAMIQFLQEYIALETVFPNPGYEKAIALLIHQATDDGFTYQQVPLPSGFPALIITYRGSNPSLPS